MFVRIVAIVILFVQWDGGSSGGRRGNEHYQNERYREAANSYREAIGRQADSFGLHNNLGAALYRTGDAVQATGMFERALQLAGSPTEFGLAAYNAGAAAFAAGDLQNALIHFKQAIRANPDDRDARYNYEFVKRRLSRNRPEAGAGSGPGKPGPEEQQGEQSESGAEKGSGEQQPQQSPSQQQSKLSPEEAENILEALQHDEEQLLKARKRLNDQKPRVEKDW